MCFRKFSLEISNGDVRRDGDGYASAYGRVYKDGYLERRKHSRARRKEECTLVSGESQS